MRNCNKPESARTGLWVLLILYCIGAVISFGVLVLAAMAPDGPVDFAMLAASTVVLILRGIGFVRLFHFRQDAWTYLAAAFLVVVASDALDFLLGGAAVFEEGHPPITTFIGYGVAVAVIVYAFRICNPSQAPNA